MKKPWKKIVLTAGAALLALSLGACTSGSAETGQQEDAVGAELTTLSVATIGIVSDGALLAGIDQGFFEEEGLEIETSIVANPSAALAAVQGGQVDIAYTQSIPLLQGLATDIPVQILAPADGVPVDPEAIEAMEDPLALYGSAANDITSIEQLEGATISVPAREAQLEVTIAGALEEVGVDPGSINWVVLDFTSAVAALESGNVDAAGLVYPFAAQAEDDGHELVASPLKAFLEHGVSGMWVVGDEIAESRSDELAAFERAIVKSNAFAQENVEVAVQAALDYNDSTATVEETVPSYWTTEIELADLERTNAKLVALGYMNEELDLAAVMFNPSN